MRRHAWGTAWGRASPGPLPSHPQPSLPTAGRTLGWDLSSMGTWTTNSSGSSAGPWSAMGRGALGSWLLKEVSGRKSASWAALCMSQWRREGWRSFTALATCGDRRAHRQTPLSSGRPQRSPAGATPKAALCCGPETLDATTPGPQTPQDLRSSHLAASAVWTV